MIVDKLKLSLAVLLVAGGIGGFYYLSDKPDLVRALVILLSIAAAVAVTATTEIGRRTWEFLKGARLELRKVVWPEKKETMQLTLVVFVMVILVAIYMWVVDWGLHKIVRVVTG